MTDNEVIALENPADNPRIRALILRNVHKPVRELAETTGLSVEQVIAARNELLSGIDSLSVEQTQTKLLMDLQELAEVAKSEFETTPDARSKAPLLAASISAMKLVLQELRMAAKDQSPAITALNEMRQRELVTIYAETGMPFLAWLEENPESTLSERTAKYQELLTDSARAMDRRYAGE